MASFASICETTARKPSNGFASGREGMKLYDTRTAPNPRRVRVFLAEKGIEIPHVQQIDLGKLEQKGSSLMMAPF